MDLRGPPMHLLVFVLPGAELVPRGWMPGVFSSLVPLVPHIQTEAAPHPVCRVEGVDPEGDADAPGRGGVGGPVPPHHVDGAPDADGGRPGDAARKIPRRLLVRPAAVRMGFSVTIAHKNSFL